MRLYVNEKEIPFLKDALKVTIAINEKYPSGDNQIIVDRLGDLLERVELCEQLQNNRRRSEK